MPRYFFHVFNAETVHDKDGVTLPDRDAALAMGRRAVAGFISEQIIAGERIDPKHRIEIVERETGWTATMRFGDFVSPASAPQGTGRPGPGADTAR